MIQLIFNTLSLYLWCIIVHEIGHYFYVKVILKQDARIVMEIKNLTLFNMDAKLGVEANYNALSKKERYAVYGSGVFFGLVIIMVALCYNAIYAILILPYILSCIPDLKNMAKCLNR